MTIRIRRRGAITLALAGLAVALFLLWRAPCLSTWTMHGVDLPICPDGKFRQTLQVNGASLKRGTAGTVQVWATAHYPRGQADLTVLLPRVTPELFLVDPRGKELPLAAEKGWSEAAGVHLAQVTLPVVPDGDYLLRAKAKTSVGEGTVDAALPLYAPARVHVITDRPLYRPGDTVRFRAVVLRAADLAPLDGRPGTWFVNGPDGEVLLEEKSPAGEWGVTASTFPVDRGAPTGTWRVRWRSGDNEDAVTFRVEPFTLPRFRIDASTPQPFYRAGERPTVQGQVVYSSGAPVADAVLELQWTHAGDWPPPNSWMEGGLPKAGKTDANGHYSLELPPIPADLKGQVTLSARIGAVDPAGDRVEGSASVLLSEDAIQAAALTELGDGIVEGFSNRMFLRVTTAAGGLLPGAHLKVRRAWEARDKGIEAVADEDGVAAFQLDPGPAVNVVIPPMPVRPPPREKPMRRGSTQDLIGDREPPLRDQLAMDGWIPSLNPCARFADGSESGTVTLQVEPSGKIAFASGQASLVSTCLARVLRTEHLPAGKSRMYSVEFTASSEDFPKVNHQVTSPSGDTGPLEQSLRRAGLDARACLPKDANGSSLPRLLSWRLRPGQTHPTLTWLPDPGASSPRTSEEVTRCIEARFSKVTVKATPVVAQEEESDEEPPSEAVGFVRFSVEPSPRSSTERPEATVMLGYEFLISARDSGEELGSTRLRMAPGTLPPVRLRANPVLAQPGGTVAVELIRGPGFQGELPEKLYGTMEQKPLEAVLDKKTHTAKFQLAADAKGWLEVSWGGARTLVYVRPVNELTVEVRPEKERYAPGQLAILGIQTSVHGQGVQAAVGLFGVDQSLAQLVPLPGPDDMGRVRPTVGTPSPAFGSLDGQALAMGRIRGANASAATILRVTNLPGVAEAETAVSPQGAGTFDPNEELTDHFYTVLGELHTQVRTWEEDAPKGELMHPQTMAGFWDRALDACAKRGEPVEDSYGRRLKLSALPGDLLALVAPRAVVVEGTRLPEDVEDWGGWVAKEKP